MVLLMLLVNRFVNCLRWFTKNGATMHSTESIRSSDKRHQVGDRHGVSSGRCIVFTFKLMCIVFFKWCQRVSDIIGSEHLYNILSLKSKWRHQLNNIFWKTWKHANLNKSKNMKPMPIWINRKTWNQCTFE